MAGELFKAMAGVDIVHVPYKGSSGARTDILGGQVQMMFDAITTMAPHVQAGKLRALGTSGKARSGVLPGTPTVSEAGVPGYEAVIWLGFMAPAVAWLMRTVSRRLYRLARSSQLATIDLSYAVEENVLANRVVRLHEAQPAQAGRFRALSLTLRRLAMKSAVASALITPTMHMLAAAALSVVICIALWQSDNGMTVGGFAAFVAALMMLIAPVKRLSQVTSPITRALAALERAIDLIDQSTPESGGSFAVDRAHGRIELRGVTVRYPNAARPALADLSLEVHPGEVIALVGPSGSGKTTLANLLPRFVDFAGGQLLLDGVDADRYTAASMRQQFALVTQEPLLFQGTVLDNLRYARPDATREEVEAAAKVFGVPAHLGEAPTWVSENMRDPGYHTALGLLYYGVSTQAERPPPTRRTGGFLTGVKRLFANA